MVHHLLVISQKIDGTTTDDAEDLHSVRFAIFCNSGKFMFLFKR